MGGEGSPRLLTFTLIPGGAERQAWAGNLTADQASVEAALGEKFGVAAGLDEVILYVNVGLKPHAQVKDEMARFAAEVAPAFARP